MTNPAAITVNDAAHLLRRTGFGTARADDIARFATLDRRAAVDLVLAGLRTTATTPLPTLSTLSTSMPQVRGKREALTDADRTERKTARQAMEREGLALKAWWFEELVTSSSTLTERLVLMWHGHFTSSLQKVKRPVLLAGQNAMLRLHAAGSFRDLLHAVVVDPAMLFYLDGQQNRASAPNENFARELLELFTLGVGHYSEHDVKEVARAFAGTAIDHDTGTVVVRRRQQDRRDKTILTETGPFAGHDVVELLLRQAATAQTITALFWRTFVNTDAPPARHATAFAQHLDLRRLLRDVLLDEAFWAPTTRLSLVKSPVEIVVGTWRLGEKVIVDGGVDPDAVAGTPAWSVRMLRQLGQDLFDPPDVRGWPGQTRWVTTATLPRRLIVTRTIAGLVGVDVDIADPEFQLR